MIFFKLALGLLVFILVYHFLTRKYLNPYKLIMIFGKKGAGKSTLLTKFALQHMKKGWNVYSTEPITGCYLIDPSEIGYIQIPPESLLLIDEVGMVWDNRNFKNFKPEVRNWFKLQRHYHVKVIMFSQTFDIDKKLRDLTDCMYLVVNKFRVFSYGKRILKKIVLKDAEADAPSTIAENLKFESLFFFWCGSRTLTFIPKYTKYFNSFEAPELKHRDFQKIEDSADVSSTVLTKNNAQSDEDLHPVVRLGANHNEE